MWQRRPFNTVHAFSRSLDLNRELAGHFKLISFRHLQKEQENMNRRKKINQLLKANAKKASAKLAPKSKSKYISKADRLKLAAESGQDSSTCAES
ncbi:hypothetical protein EMIT0196MI5_230060 [Pseudomonas sp. IT-196MI5]